MAEAGAEAAEIGSVEGFERGVDGFGGVHIVAFEIDLGWGEDEAAEGEKGLLVGLEVG